MRRLGVVTGLRFELEIFARALNDGTAPDKAPLLCCRGIGAERARQAANDALAAGAEALLSFGSAGGLDPGLEAGTIVIASEARSLEDAALPADKAWAERLGATAGQAYRRVSAAIVSPPRPVRLPAEKAALFRASGGAAVDLESYAVAEVAARAGVPFLAVRAVVDGAGRVVPRAALAAVGDDGGVAWPALARAIASRPWESVGLMRLAADAGAARRSLRGFVRRALPGFGL